LRPHRSLPSRGQFRPLEAQNGVDSSPATGWFHPSHRLGVLSPSTHFFKSSHQGVLMMDILEALVPPSEVPSPCLSVVLFASSTARLASSTHLAARRAIRAPSQSMKRDERDSSSSLHANWICSRFEKRRWKAVCGIGVNVVVRVVTGDEPSSKDGRFEFPHQFIVISHLG